MRAIIVDDEVLMLKRFVRMSANIPALNIVGSFESPFEAFKFAQENPVDIAFLDVEMPQISGIELAKQLRQVRKDILIVFVSAYDQYVWESNQIGGDYYLMKPYDEKMLNLAMERINLIARRQEKTLYIRTFGRFLVLRNGEPISLSGKAKEILALVVTKGGKEISNGEIYYTIWEDRPCDNASMNVFYNALRRLKKALKKENIENLLISTRHGQMVDINLFDCDYYEWKKKNTNSKNAFEGEFLSEYSWGEYILASMLNEEY
ncbi:MAG: response regulator [Clostridia bacterium]|nr:response regulator [Clostridia bacterium]